MRVLYIDLALWQQVVDSNGLRVFAQTIDGGQKVAFAGNTDLVYRADVTSSDVAAFDAAYGQQTAVDSEDEAIARIIGLGAVLTPRDREGKPVVASAGRFGAEVIYATHNLTDETTWYSSSLRASDVALFEGDGFTYSLGQTNIIDLSHGKVFDEDGIIEDQQILNPGDPHGYAMAVHVDGAEMTQREPFALSGGDYTVDYAAGTINFAASQAGKAVTASYSYANGSQWILQPLPGKALIIEAAEVQFAKDVQMEGTFFMDVHGYVEQFAPTLWDQQNPAGPLWYEAGSGAPISDPAALLPDTLYYDDAAPQLYAVVDTGGVGNPANYIWAPVPAGAVPGGTRIRLERTNYKTIDQLIDEAVGAHPEIPVLGGARGYTQPRHIFEFRYSTVRTLWSSLGMWVCISMQDDQGFSGERATATFYCTSEADIDATKAFEKLSS